MLEKIVHPLPFRALNFTGDLIRRCGVDLLSLDPGTLLAAARREARLDDFGSRDFERGLIELLESAEREAKLTMIGRMGVRGVIVNALTTRLLLEELKKTQSELFRSELAQPLIVIGLPRSGTTFLHRLLALAPDARSLAYWEVRKPLPRPGRDRRLAQARQEVRAVHFLAPGLDAKHVSMADDPEECMFLLDPTLVSVSFWVTAPVYSYLDWYLEQDQHAPYRVYREHLQVFQAAAPDKRLTLKAPIHLPNLGALLAAVPNAKVVQLHRDPAPVLASVNSLFYTLHRVVTDGVDRERLGRANLKLIQHGMQRHLETRCSLPAGRIVDVYYDDLVADPLRAVRGIYDQLGLPFGAEFESRLRAFVAQNPKHKHGAHRYRAGDFGLSDAEIRKSLGAYIERFPRVLGAKAA